MGHDVPTPTSLVSVQGTERCARRFGADGVPDLSDAYAKGIGEWDKVAIAYGYQDFAPGTDEAQALERTLSEAFARGLMYLTDQDARPASSSSSVAHLWDNGTNAIDELSNVPLVTEVAETDNQRIALKLIVSRQTMARPYVAPPGIPADRLAALRDGFAATFKDPQFIADCDKQELSCSLHH